MREIVTVFVKLPEVPVIVTGNVPTAAVPAAVSVRVLVVAVVVGLNDAATPAGKPEADKLTLPLKPNCGVMVMVFVLLAPCVMVMLLKEVESEKFGDGGAGVVSETLSKVAVAKEEMLRLLTAKPTYTFCAMVTVWLVPNCVQVVPLLEANIVNTFPLRTSFSQFGSVALPTDE
jgi:hypothetical protein